MQYLIWLSKLVSKLNLCYDLKTTQLTKPAKLEKKRQENCSGCRTCFCLLPSKATESTFETGYYEDKLGLTNTTRETCYKSGGIRNTECNYSSIVVLKQTNPPSGTNYCNFVRPSICRIQIYSGGVLLQCHTRELCWVSSVLPLSFE